MGITVRNLSVKGKMVVGPPPAGSTWTLNFTGGDCGSISCTTNIETIPENVTLFFEVTVNGGGFSWQIFKNGILVFGGTTSNDPPELTYTLSYNTNDTLNFNFGGILGDGIMTIKENNTSGRIISTFNVYVFD